MGTANSNKNCTVSGNFHADMAEGKESIEFFEICVVSKKSCAVEELCRYWLDLKALLSHVSKLPLSVNSAALIAPISQIRHVPDINRLYASFPSLNSNNIVCDCSREVLYEPKDAH